MPMGNVVFVGNSLQDLKKLLKQYSLLTVWGGLLKLSCCCCCISSIKYNNINTSTTFFWVT